MCGFGEGVRASRVFQEAAITLLTAWLGCNSLGSLQFSVSCERSDTTNTEEEGLQPAEVKGSNSSRQHSYGSFNAHLSGQNRIRTEQRLKQNRA